MHRIEDILNGLKGCRAAGCCEGCPLDLPGNNHCIDILHEDAEQLIRALMKENAELREKRFVGKHERRARQ